MSRLSNSFYRYVIIVFVMIITCSNTCGQSLNKLRANKKKIEKEINYLNKLLKTGEKDKKVTLNKIVIVNRQIHNRERLILNIEKEVKTFEVDIKANKHVINDYSLKLSNLNRQYSSIIYNSWLHKSRKNKLIFILSSYDFNQAYLRLKYLRQYSYYTQKLVGDISNLKGELIKQNADLKAKLLQKEQLAKLISNEKLSLAREKQKHNRYFSTLSAKEKSLKKKLKKQLRAQAKLSSKIKRIIKLEANKKRRRSLSENNLSRDFAKNKGKLPWPTHSGFISSKYGVHPHPVAKRTKVRNDGIDITTEKESKCYSVFNGKVSEVFNFPGLNNILMIRHGEYLTVYANLLKVFVRKGESVKTGQSVGLIYTDPDEKKTVLKFQVWKNSSKQNPSRWLSK